MEKWYEKAKRLLDERGIPHRVVGDALGVSPGSATHKLNGDRKASIDEIIIIAGLLNMSLSELCEDLKVTTLSDDEMAMLEAYRNTPNEDKPKAIKVISLLSD